MRNKQRLERIEEKAKSIEDIKLILNSNQTLKKISLRLSNETNSEVFSLKKIWQQLRNGKNAK